MEKSYSRRPRLLCRGDGDGRKGGTSLVAGSVFAAPSLGRELGLGRVARASLLYADERAPGRLVQERAVGDVHLVEYFPPLVDVRRFLWRVIFDLREERPHLARDRLDLDGRGALFALQRLVHVLRGDRRLLLLRGEFGRGWAHYRGAWHVRDQ